MARIEALLKPVPGSSDCIAVRTVIEQQAAAWGAVAEWLDERNVSLTVALAPTSMPVKLLFELDASGALVVLVSSQEGMVGGAPQTRLVLEQLLGGLAHLLVNWQVVFRSDRDGPVRHSLASNVQL
jgi:hypothetical protein